MLFENLYRRGRSDWGMLRLIRCVRSYMGGLFSATKSAAFRVTSPEPSSQFERGARVGLVPYDENLLERTKLSGLTAV